MKHWGKKPSLGRRLSVDLFFPGLNAQSSIVLKLVGLRLPSKRSEISPHPWAPCLWQPSFFLDRWARAKEAESIGGEEEVQIVEMVVLIRWKMTWSGQTEAGAEEEKEAWIVTSPVRPSPAGPQEGRTGWSGVSS